MVSVFSSAKLYGGTGRLYGAGTPFITALNERNYQWRSAEHRSAGLVIGYSF
jgi:hypothetical protein